MSMPVESGAAGIALLIKTKLLAFLPALIGAGLMAAFRPPKTRKEMFMQGAVALGSSFLFGPIAVSIAAQWLPPGEDLKVAVYGLMGALSWGCFGGLAHLRDKVASDPVGTIKEIKDVL